MKKILTVLLTLALLLTVCAQAMAEETTLTVLSWHSETDLAPVVEGFEAANPGIKVEVQYAPPIDDYVTRFQALNATGELPDVWVTAAENLADVFASDTALDLKDLLAGSGLAQGNIDRYTDESGRVVAYAPTAWVSGIAYNKNMLDEAGLDVPTDWDSWLNALAVLTEKGYQALAVSSGNVCDYADMVAGLTTVWNDRDYDNRVNHGEATYAEGWTEPLHLWYDTYVATGYFGQDCLGITDDDAMNIWLLGDACFKGVATWNVDSINQTVDFDWGIIPYYGPNGAELTLAAINVGWSVNAKGANVEAGKKWIEYLLSDEGAGLYYGVTGGLLCTGAPYELDERLQHLAELQMKNDFYYATVAFKYSDGIASVKNTALQEVIMGNATIEDVVQRMDDKFAELGG